MKLGKLEEVDIRTIWQHEQYDFSKWLSQEENIKALGDALNISLTDIETEKFVGSYRCDIVGKDELSGKTVLVENQLEATNHDHLGKLITYASGLDACVIVWIVASAKQEHASAIEWLNKNTSSDVAFFLIEIHAYRIGISEPAPRFEIIEQPNDFAKTAKIYANAGDLNASQTCRLEFWTMFNDILDQRKKEQKGLFNKRKATVDHWYDIAVGTSKCHLQISLVNKEHKIRVGMWIPDSKELYDALYVHRDEIEKAAEGPLEWDRMDDNKAACAFLNITGLDFDNNDNYPELINTVIDKVMLLKKAFGPYVK